MRKDHARQRVLEADESSRRFVNIFTFDKIGQDVVFEDEVVTVFGLNGVRLSLRMEGNATGFVAMDMGANVAEHRVGRLLKVSGQCVESDQQNQEERPARPDGELVAERARTDEQSRFLARQLGDAVL